MAKKNLQRTDSGFTIIELLIALAIIAALIATSLFIINPAQRLAETRNNERELDINTILNAIGQNISDNTGTFNCAAGPIPTTTTLMGSSTYNLYDCLVFDYLSQIPADPTTGTEGNSSSTYDTKYTITQNATTSRITLDAPDAELGETISVTR
jgi:prepilin-type N-terminal cleavage/methylation domain-containing protein